MKLIQVSDLHLIDSSGKLYGSDPQQRLDQAIEDINHFHSDAELVVITGDLTHWGDAKSYAVLRQSLSQLSVDYRLMIGNHDNRDTFMECFPEVDVDSNGYVQSTAQTAHGTLVFLDTNEPGTHAGRLCDARIDWLESVFDNREPPYYVFMHHPPCEIGIEPMDRIRIVDEDAYTPVFMDNAHQIRHIFFGHIHRPLGGSWLDIPLSAVPSLNHQVALDFDRTGDNIDFSHEPPGYAVALIGDEHIVTHLRNFTYDAGVYPAAVNKSAAEERSYALGIA